MTSWSLPDRRRAGTWTWLPEFAQATLPRYTSYPPANRFNASIDAAAAGHAITSLGSDATLSLYVHIPFCKKLCWYCGCHTSVPTIADPVDSYLEALGQEIRLIAAKIPGGVRVTHLHFGGGSPDMLTPDQVDTLMATLRGQFRFDPDAEIAVELDPRGVTSELVAAFVDGGLNRASLGVQVLSPDVQARINRIQPRDVIETAIVRLRTAGVRGLNLDMMYGLPGQTREDVIETALFAATQDADRIAVFGYAHVPWFKKHQGAIKADALPNGEQRFRQAEAAADTLTEAGYVQIGFDHFAAPGDTLVKADRAGQLRRNFQGYTDDSADGLIGFGASAISSLPTLTWQNSPDTAAYRATIARGDLPVVRGVAPTAMDRRVGGLIEKILCQFEAEIPADLRIEACPALAALEEAQLIVWCGQRLVVTERGRPYVRNVAAAFDPDMKPSETRHSLAV